MGKTMKKTFLLCLVLTSIGCTQGKSSTPAKDISTSGAPVQSNPEPESTKLDSKNQTQNGTTKSDENVTSPSALPLAAATPSEIFQCHSGLLYMSTVVTTNMFFSLPNEFNNSADLFEQESTKAGWKLTVTASVENQEKKFNFKLCTRGGCTQDNILLANSGDSFKIERHAPTDNGSGAFFFVNCFRKEIMNCNAPKLYETLPDKRTTSLSYNIKRIDTEPSLAPAYKTPSGTIWGPVVIEANTCSPLLKSKTEAAEYCRAIGARLPNKEEYVDLRCTSSPCFDNEHGPNYQNAPYTQWTKDPEKLEIIPHFYFPVWLNDVSSENSYYGTGGKYPNLWQRPLTDLLPFRCVKDAEKAAGTSKECGLTGSVDDMIKDCNVQKELKNGKKWALVSRQKRREMKDEYGIYWRYGNPFFSVRKNLESGKIYSDVIGFFASHEMTSTSDPQGAQFSAKVCHSDKALFYLSKYSKNEFTMSTFSELSELEPIMGLRKWHYSSGYGGSYKFLDVFGWSEQGYPLSLYFGYSARPGVDGYVTCVSK